MWDKFKKFLSYSWAAPVTAPGLLYASLFQLLGWYTWYGVSGDALVWIVNLNKSPLWLLNLWKNWYGQTVGNVVVLKLLPEKKPLVLLHEKKHVDQIMKLGIFHPIIYSLCYLAIKYGCTGSDPYYSNSFELDARRAAGQIIDVESAMSKINSAQKSS